MNVKLIKAMQGCCAKADGGRLGQPTLLRGYLVATDQIVLVRYREGDWDPAKMPRHACQLWAHEIQKEGIKPTTKIGVDERGFVIPHGDSHGYPDSKYPDVIEDWDLYTRNPHNLVCDTDPKQLMRVLRVFDAAGVPACLVNQRGATVTLEGFNPKTGASVEAIICGMRR